MDPKTQEILADAKDRFSAAYDNRNIENSERLLSVATGAFVLYTGITRMFKTPLSSLAEVAVGGALLLRGATGYCPVKGSTRPPRRKVKVVERTVTE